MSEEKLDKKLPTQVENVTELPIAPDTGSSSQIQTKSSGNEVKPHAGSSGHIMAKSSEKNVHPRARNTSYVRRSYQLESNKRSSNDDYATPTPAPSLQSSIASLNIAAVSSEFIAHNPRQFDRELRNRRTSRLPKPGGGLIKSSSVTSKNSLVLTMGGDDYDHFGGRSAGARSYVKGQQSNSSMAVKSTSSQSQKKGDLELWWINSPIWRRTVPLMCIIMLLMTLIHAGLAVYYLVAENTSAADYDVCKTPACMDIAHWIKEGLDREVEPCDNFYQFVCNRYNVGIEKYNYVPQELNFKYARFTFNTKSGLANMLKPKNDPKNLMIPFYKSCIDEKKTDATDTQTLAYIISLAMPYLYKKPENFSTWINIPEAAVNITSSIGHCGLLRIKYLEFPDIALLPPLDWISKFKIKLATVEGRAKYKEVVKKTYETLWKALETYGGAPVIPYEDAASFAVDILHEVSNFDFHAPTRPKIESEKRVSYNYIDKLIGPGWKIEVIPIEKKKYTVGDMVNLILATQNATKTNFSRAMASYWIFCILEFYHDELSIVSREQLNIENVFAADTHVQRDTSLERFCFDALTNHMCGYTMNQLVHELKDVRRLLPNVRRDGQMIMRALRDIYYAEHLQEYLTSYQSRFMEYFLNPTTNISLQFPFPHSPRTQKYFDEQESYIANVRLEDNYLLNIRELTMHKFKGEAKSWREGKLDYKIVPNEDLELILEHIDNGVEFKNIISPPIVLFDQPLYGNEMGVFDRAGATILLARSYLSLLGMNWKDTRALLRFVHPMDLQEMEKRPQTLANFLKGKCIFNYTADYRVSFFQKKSSRDALALAIAFRLSKNPERYQTVYFKENDTIAKEVEQSYNADGTVSYVIYRPEWASSDKFEKLNSDDFKPVPNYRKKHKFSYKKLSSGLEDFNTEQLFFIAAVRHHCYSRNDSHPYSANVNRVLKQLPAFSKTWNCPLGSSMNPHSKCTPEAKY